MTGGPHKFSRSGAAAATKRGATSLLPHPRPRLSTAPPPRGSRNPSSTAPHASPAAAEEERFRLVHGNPDTFAAFIRLAPDLVNEIRRVEESGGKARIRFDVNRNNPAVNVIDAGGKEFRFTWSQETGDLCDIYEERESGEGGNGLLVGSGCPWRKLNVQRILDESTKNHVKMRSEEAERKQKSRKAIVLDSSNPSMKNQAKALAAVEVNQWRSFKQNKEPPVKKQKVEPPGVGGLSKANQKSGFSGTTPVKGRLSTSPAASPPNRSVFGAPVSAYSKSNLNKGQAIEADAVTVSVTKAAIVSDRNGPSRNFGPTEETAVPKGNQDAKPADLQEMLIKVLKENPTGMGLKDLEKAVGRTFPNSTRKIPAILQKIAALQAPGKYLLKSGIELETIKRIPARSERSPEDNQHKLPVSEQNDVAALARVDLNIAEKSPQYLEEQAPLGSSINENEEHANFMEGSEVPRHTSDLFGDTMGSTNAEGRAGSSSDSGSDNDSDSDSSGSGSDSGSQSKSRSGSPAGSGSGSSSDSGSESSANSKEGSDVDVDIMTSDDEKEIKQDEVATKQESHGSPAIDIDDHGSEDVEIEDLPAHDQAADLDMRLTTAAESGAMSVHDLHYTSPIEGRIQGHLKPPDFSGRETMVVDDFRHGKEGSQKSRGKSKRNADGEHFKEMPGPAKKSKVGVSGRLNEDHPQGHSFDADMEKGVKNGYRGRSTLEPVQSGGRVSPWLNDPDIAERNGRSAGTWGQGFNNRDLIAHTDESLSNKRSRPSGGLQDSQGMSSEKISKKYNQSGNRQYMHHSSQSGKKGDNGKRRHMKDDFYDSLVDSSPKTSFKVEAEKSFLVNGKGPMLHRALSELELGELREPLQEEAGRDMQPFEEKESLKQMETNRRTSDSWNADLTNVRPAIKPASDPVKPSSPDKRSGASRNSGDSSRKRSTDPYVEGPLRPSRKAVPSHPSNSTVEARLLSDKVTERLEESETQHGDMEGYGQTHNKLHDGAKFREPKLGHASNYANGTKSQDSNNWADASHRKIGDSLNGDFKRSGSSSDENASYSKYDRNEPELKGPVKDLSQYKEYVEEFQEKYESYGSLNKILEAHMYGLCVNTFRNIYDMLFQDVLAFRFCILSESRSEFEKLRSDLQTAKGRDMERYHKIVSHLRERYHQSGPKHKRMKKIFVVLHEELQHLKQRIKEFAATYAKK
ncbi:hypothetical protein AKJ16_DCAP13088 [Drosera capensis]